MATLLIALISLVAQFFLPWWVVAPIALGVCYFVSKTPVLALAEGTAGVAMVWLAYALFTHIRTEGIMTERMSQLLLKGPANLLLTITPLVGGFVGGLAGLTGYYLRQLTRPANG
jgi:hypothetical protein